MSTGREAYIKIDVTKEVEVAALFPKKDLPVKKSDSLRSSRGLKPLISLMSLFDASDSSWRKM